MNSRGIKLVGFDADDTLWRSQDYFDDAQSQYERILGSYVDLSDAEVRNALYVTERDNIQFFGYGVKGMLLSMIESGILATEGKLRADDIAKLILMGKELLRHPVDLLPGIMTAVDTIASQHPVVLITKGDLFHQEAKVRESGLAQRFKRIEIVSEKDQSTYRRLFAEFEIEPHQFLMIGNSLKSDIEPVLALGGWGVHLPYHLTWTHEVLHELDASLQMRMRTANEPHELPQLVAELCSNAMAQD